MALMVLVSSTCFGADVHYCEDDIKSFALFDVADPCSNMKEVKPEKLSKCCMARKKKEEQALTGKPVFKKKKCCHNEQVAFKADQQLDHSPVFFAPISVAALDVPVIAPVFVFGIERKVESASLKAPPISRYGDNFQAFYQVFRI